MSLLELDTVSCYYGDFRALLDVSVEVREGETVAVIGANGAGKTTLLSAAAGVVPPRLGEVRFDGVPITRLRAHRRVPLGISLVPEGRRVFPSLTVEENLRIGAARARRGPWTVRRVYEVFPLLEPLARRFGSGLSGGEQQALAIGRALMANPRLLLVDELSLGLAPVVIRQLYATLPRIAESGTTIVLVEQDVGQALKAADRAYCLLEGRVSLHGRASELEHDRVVSAYFGV